MEVTGLLRNGRRREIEIALEFEDEEEGLWAARVLVGLVVVVPVHGWGTAPVKLRSFDGGVGLLCLLATVNKNNANRIIVFMYLFQSCPVRNEV